MRVGFNSIIALYLMHVVGSTDTDTDNENIDADLDKSNSNEADIFSLLDSSLIPHPTPTDNHKINLQVSLEAEMPQISTSPVSAVLDIKNVTNTVVIPFNILSPESTSESDVKTKELSEDDKEDNDDSSVNVDLDIEIDNILGDEENKSLDEEVNNEKAVLIHENIKVEKKKSNNLRKVKSILLEPKKTEPQSSDSDIDSIWKLLESSEGKNKNDGAKKVESKRSKNNKKEKSKMKVKLAQQKKRIEKSKHNAKKTHPKKHNSKNARKVKKHSKKLMSQNAKYKHQHHSHKKPNCNIKKNNVRKQVKKFHTLPAKRHGCLVEQTVIIPSEPLRIPTIPPPAYANIRQKWNQQQRNNDNNFYKRENVRIDNNFAPGPVRTITFTQLTVVPVMTTQFRIATSTIIRPTTQFFTEVLYTPYMVTTTSTDTMYMMKVTTVTKGSNPGGCNACELDANGMVIPAGQMPPGIFATPINEIDTNQFEIIGYAGINPTNFNPNIQGYQIPTRK
jgi:hypothetical protein